MSGRGFRRLIGTHFRNVLLKDAFLPHDQAEAVESVLAELGRCGLATGDEVYVCTFKCDSERKALFEPFAFIDFRGRAHWDTPLNRARFDAAPEHPIQKPEKKQVSPRPAASPVSGALARIKPKAAL